MEYGQLAVLADNAGKEYGRLAQLVERNIDVVDVRGSNPLPPTRTYIGAWCNGNIHDSGS